MKEKREEKISIIVPIYNLEGLIDEMIQSVICQTYKNIEIILIDDGSIDNSWSICEKWAERDGRIKCVHQENAGVSVARNAGLVLSEGDYILFIDGDDMIAPDMCEKLLTKLKQDAADMSFCGFLNVFRNETESMIPNYKMLVNYEILNAFIVDGCFFFIVWNKLFRREVLMDTKGEFIQFTPGIFVGEDALWLSKVLKNVNKASCVPQALYFWKRREDSATQGENKIRTDEKYLTVLKAYRCMIFEMNEEHTRREICKKYLGACRDCMIKAYEEKKYDLSKNLLKRICEDKKLYGYFDFFFVKLLLCSLLIRINAPLLFIKKMQTIKIQFRGKY